MTLELAMKSHHFYRNVHLGYQCDACADRAEGKYQYESEEIMGEDEMTDKEKQFAALAEPKDEITYADKIAGATKKEGKLSIERAMSMMDEMIDELQESRSKKKI